MPRVAHGLWIVVLLALLLPHPPALAAADPLITEYPIPTGESYPFGITAGPDGNLWFAEYNIGKIGKITPAGVVTEYFAGRRPFAITAGPDGNLWFTAVESNQIGRITPAGAVTDYATPTASNIPYSITAGPDGNLWFTELSANQIGRITPAGAVTEYAIPAAASNPDGIAAGPDGNVWFTENSANKIGKITPAGAVTEYPFPADSGRPSAITSGPDGNLWFTVEMANTIAKINPTTGAITLYSLPAGANAVGITAGPDGNVWFTDYNVGKIGKITPAGAVTEYPTPTPGSLPFSVAAGPDGNLWFTEHNANQIGKLQLAATGPPPPLAILTDATLPNGTLGVAYATTLAATGGTGPYTWAIAAGSFPPGLRLDAASGVISGTPTTPGTFRFTVTVTNSAFATATQDFTFTDPVPASAGSVTEYALLTPNGGPIGITSGPDGNLWFTEFQSNEIGKISPTTGAVSEYPLPTTRGRPHRITSGPDGNLWFTEYDGGIGKINPTTGAITEYPLSPFSSPEGITSGPDGSLWFAESTKIGKINPTTGAITEYAIPTPLSAATGITAGPDGNLWFTVFNMRMVGKINPTTGAITEYPTPTANSGPYGITSGPDGNLWFSEVTADKIAKINPTTGAITEYAIPTENSGPYGITSGPDGSLWFTESSKIGKITLAGVISEYPISTAISGPRNITAGPGRTLWFTEYNTNQIGKLQLAATAPTPPLMITTDATLPNGTIGVAYSATLAATGGTAPYTWSVASGSLPPGLSLDAASGTIGGTPTTAGAFGFTIKVTDSGMATATRQFALAPPPPTGSAGGSYTLPIAIPAPPSGGTSGGTAACTGYALAAGSTLPAGLTLNTTTGVISGTPTNGGTYTFTVQCAIGGGQTATKEFTITINNPSPTIAGLSPSTANAGGPAFTLTVNGTNFVTASTVRWNGADRATTYVSATQLTAAIGATDIATGGTAAVTVTNPAPVGGTSGPAAFTIVADTIPPTTTATPDRAANANGWYRASVAVTLSAVDNAGGSGVAKTESNLDNAGWTTYSTPVVITTEGKHTLQYRSTDNAGNVENPPGSLPVWIDKTAPTSVAGAASGPPNAAGWYNKAVGITFSGQDSLSGIDACTATTYSGPDSATASVSGACTDKAGNTSAPVAFTLKYDATGPTSVMGTADRTVNANGWYNAPVTVTFGGTDATSGIASCTTGSYIGTDSISASVSGSCTDYAGNVGKGSFALKYDATLPTVTYAGNAGTYTADQTVAITCTAADNLSGIASTTCQNISGPAYSFIVGANPYSATATDNAGNVSATGTARFTVTVDAASLSNVVNRFVANKGQANALTTKIAKGNMQAFINEVNAQTGKALTQEQAAILIKLAKGL